MQLLQAVAKGYFCIVVAELGQVRMDDIWIHDLTNWIRSKKGVRIMLHDERWRKYHTHSYSETWKQSLDCNRPHQPSWVRFKGQKA